MSEGLSLKEIEQLEQRAKSAGPGGNSAKETAPFDFRLPLRVSDIHLRILKGIFEGIAEKLSAFFSSRLQTQVVFKVASTDQIYYSEYIPSVAEPSFIYIFGIETTNARGLVEINIDSAFALIDRMLGGNGNSSKHSMDITQIEQRVLKLLPDKINHEVESALIAYHNFKFITERFESSIENAQLTLPHESVLLTSFEIIIGEQRYGFNYCLATNSIDVILKHIPAEKAQISVTEEDHEISADREVLTSHLMGTLLPVKVEFGSSKITFDELLNLEEGDIIVLTKKLTDDHEIKVAEKVLFHGKPGIVNNNRAIKITRKENIQDKLFG